MTVDLTPRQRSLLTGAAIASGVGIILHISFFIVSILPLTSMVLIIMAMSEPPAPPAHIDPPPWTPVGQAPGEPPRMLQSVADRTAPGGPARKPPEAGTDAPHKPRRLP